MPRLSKPQLLDIILRSIKNSGWQAICLSRSHPFSLRVFNSQETHTISIYIWNMTHGGGPRAANEFRIQITGTAQFEQIAGTKTLILGWWEDAGVFAGFDFRKHSGPLGASPSMQVKEEYLRNAHVNGFSAYPKGNKEIVITFRPDFLVEYIKNLEPLHDFGQSTREIQVLNQVAVEPEAVNDTVINSLARSRQSTIRSIKKALRDSSFSQRVLTAYGFRCAVCSIQLNLIEAAHIVPVAVDGSTDDTSNGIALCFLHHKAFDNSLIAIADDYHVLISDGQIRRFQEDRRAGGLRGFKNALRPIILLPPATTDRPHVEYLRQAREIRQWEE